MDIIIASILPWLTSEDPLKLFSSHLIGHVYCSMIKGSWAHFCSSLCFHLICKSPFHHSQSYLMKQLVSAWAWKLLNCMSVQVLLFLSESEVSSIKKLKHCNTWCLGPDCNPKHKHTCVLLPESSHSKQKKWASFPAAHPQHWELDGLKAGIIAQAQCPASVLEDSVLWQKLGARAEQHNTQQQQQQEQAAHSRSPGEGRANAWFKH